MERVAFILEQTNERVSCMLNPESFEVRRQAGVRRSAGIGTALSPSAMQDDPLLWTGGGQTEIRLDLLFDLSLQTGSQKVEDVRELTRPLHALSENGSEDKQAPIARFIWGKAWNVRCLVASVGERFEQFSASGCPRRSWLSMHLIRIAPSSACTKSAAPDVPFTIRSGEQLTALPVVDTTGGSDVGTGSRLDVLANEKYGNPGFWRLVASFNDLADPLHVPAGTPLRIPPRSVVEGGR